MLTVQGGDPDHRRCGVTAKHAVINRLLLQHANSTTGGCSTRRTGGFEVAIPSRRRVHPEAGADGTGYPRRGSPPFSRPRPIAILERARAAGDVNGGSRCPGPRAAVIAVPHDGDGEAVHAAVVAELGITVSPTELQDFV